MTTAAMDLPAAGIVGTARGAWRRIAWRTAAEMTSGWLAPGLAGVYAVASILIAFVGLAAGGTLQAQDFGRTAQSLLAVTLWIVPLGAMLGGALAAADDGELTLLLVQPVSWRVVFLARWAGSATAVGAAVLLAWGSAGLVIGALAGWGDVAGYAGVGGIALGAVVVGTALGAAAGGLAGGRGPTLVTALALWFLLAVAYDLVAVAAISVAPTALGGEWSAGLLAAGSPFSTLRVLGTLVVGGRDLAFGPVSAALAQSGTARLPAVFAGAVVLWTAAALVAGTRFFTTRDR